MRWWARKWNSRPRMYVVPLFFLVVSASAVALAAVFVVTRQNAAVSASIALVVLAILLITMPWMLYRRVVLPTQWLARLIWRHRRRPLWILGAIAGPCLWLLGFAAIWKADWIVGLLFLGFSVRAMSDIYESRVTLATKLRRRSIRARG